MVCASECQGKKQLTVLRSSQKRQTLCSQPNSVPLPKHKVTKVPWKTRALTSVETAGFILHGSDTGNVGGGGGSPEQWSGTWGSPAGCAVGMEALLRQQ